MDVQQYLIRVSASGEKEAVPVPAGCIPQEMLCSLLDTDVTERLRIPVKPEAWEADAVLCYLIDARSGDRGLPPNLIGTCFYHTGCPVCGDLLICACPDDHENAEITGFSDTEKELLLNWLDAQFPLMHADWL